MPRVIERITERIKNRLASLGPAFWVGLLVLAAYWYWVHPVGLARGYIEDFCSETSLNVLAKNLKTYGLPKFTTDLYMAPFGMPVPFFSWSIERDWLGTYLWMWNRDFPFLWAYFGASLLLSYCVVGYILGRMGLSKTARWLIAAGCLFFHVPRHFKIWHHYEYITQHWVYLSLFVDAWIWQRFSRERRWSWNLELWRAVCLVGILTAPGYHWGPMMLEWLLVRLGMLYVIWKDRLPKIEWSTRKAIFPSVLLLFFVLVDLLWFPPLLAEMRKMGTVPQFLGFSAKIGYVIRPLWLDPIYALIQNLGAHIPDPVSINTPESVVTIGWLYWVPLILGVILLRKKEGGPGVKHVAPFLTLMIIGIYYFTIAGGRWHFQRFIQLIIPPMKFFRVTSRWGQFMPEIAAVIIVLSWPELTAWWKKNFKRRRNWVYAFAVLSVLEVGTLLHPVNMSPILDLSTRKLLADVEKSKGDTVLDLPFCVAGGNGICTDWQCPNYPKSTVGQCFASWHGKKVYGLYQGRLVQSQCQIYNRKPYTSWFEAWKFQRCFTEPEWKDFCQYLDTQNLAAVLVYPDIWTGARSSQCESQFRAHLGAPTEEGIFLSESTPDHRGKDPMRVVRYGPRCSGSSNPRHVP